MAGWLRQHGLEVQLLAEPAEAPVDAEESTARVLRLWTAAARRRWAARAPQGATVGGVLLRAEEADLPTAGAPGGLLDWRGWDRLRDSPEAAALLEPLRRWLEGGEIAPVSPEETKPRQADSEITRLVAELDDPATKPPRRLEIGDRLAELGDPRKGVGVVEIEVPEEGFAAASEPAVAPEIDPLLAELADPKTEPPRRKAIGDRLAEIGDPRPGVGLDARGLPTIDWVKIPGGEFVYQDGERRTLATFHMARYPITNAQYQAFIDAGGYAEERWWQDLEKPQPAEPRWPQANRPRTEVDWYEAVAFSRWLSAQLGYEVRLPTEEEWERAARGTDGRAYPWGEAYESGRANVDETWTKAGPWNLQQTAAVGVYPRGASAEGVLDLAGNVWEWCLNKYQHPDQAEADASGDARVLRGGSWSGLPVNARADLRNLNFPVNRSGYVGFRLVSSAPIA